MNYALGGVKIVSLIPSYAPNNPYISQVISELKKISKVYLFTTETHTHQVDGSYYFDKSIGKNLVYKPREWIIDNIKLDWDYILYNEDDIYIPTTSVNSAVHLYNVLPKDMIPGFIRYEYIDKDNPRFIDVHPSNSVHMGGNTIIRSTDKINGVWEPWNLHSGNFLFSKDDVVNMIENKRFERTYKEYGFQYGFCDQLESAASVLYFNYRKVYPKDVHAVQCHHLPNKYITMPHNYGDVAGPGKYDILKEYEQI